MRQLIWTTLSNTTAVTDIVGVPARIYEANSLGVSPISSNPDPPFLLIHSMPNIVDHAAPGVQKVRRSAVQIFDIRAYDERGDYLRIETLLRLVRDTLLGLALSVSPSGARCTDVKWQGFGLDSDDPVLDKIFKTLTMRFLTSI